MRVAYANVWRPKQTKSWSDPPTSQGQGRGCARADREGIMLTQVPEIQLEIRSSHRIVI